MGTGVFLMVVGAILAFAVKDDLPNLNLHITGLILMIAGAALIGLARHREQHEKVTTVREESEDPDTPSHEVEETVRERGGNDRRPPD